jgi:ABC-2 type transport system ATP-binding protein
VDEFVQQASGSTVRVRSPEAAELRSLIAGPEVTVTSEETGVLTVSGLTSEQIGITAAEHGVTLFELAPQQASLEDAFMELTQDALEYKAQDPASTIVAGAGRKAS